MQEQFNKQSTAEDDEDRRFALDTELLEACEVWSNNFSHHPSEYIARIHAALEAGADANAVAVNGQTPLLLVCNRPGASPIVEDLIAHGARVNTGTSDGDRPLLHAAAEADVETMKLLIAHGADVRAVKRVPERHQGGLTYNACKIDIYSSVVYHCLSESPDMYPVRAEALKLVMDQPGAPPCSNISDIYLAHSHLWHLFPGMKEAHELHTAAATNDIPKAQELLSAGLHPDIAAKFGHDQALVTAATFGKIEMIDLLVLAGADIDLVSAQGNVTPLQSAAWAGKKEAFDHLIGLGADPCKLGKDTGDSLLAVAKKGDIADHVNTTLAHRSITAQEPIAVQKPLQLAKKSPA
jgi:ankyrin repeat protein